jgi:uncharacterized protein (DUF2252 family)
VVRTVRRRALGRRWKQLARERLADVKPVIPLGSKYWALSDAEREALTALFERREVARLVLSLNARDSDGEVELVDAAYWMKGCSSLGKLRFAALVRMTSPDKERARIALVDIKEGVESAAPAAPGAVMPAHHGERVVAGARALSPNLGERMMAADLLDRPVILRELMPQDLKLEIDQFSRSEAVQAAHYLAYVVGRAHGRQLDEADRLAWCREMQGQHAGDLDAPHWLWSSVVALAAEHERGYLEHCRRYALTTA